MRARVLMGYQAYGQGKGTWKDHGERPTGLRSLHPLDIDLFKMEVLSLGAKSILEFGPGDSTEVFAKMGIQVTTIEHIQKWYEVALERFKDYPNVRVLKGEDEMPFRVEGMGSYERFDLAFVDAPQGYFPMRKIHKGYEDCSRLNTTLLALERSPVVLLHDVTRPLERGTLNRLNVLGYKVEFIPVPYGMARITHGDENRLDPPRIEEPRGTPDGTKPKRGRKPKPERPDRRAAGGDGSP
jgi:hypothetical protein